MSAPIDRVDGKTFNCPDCNVALVYRTKSEFPYRFFTFLTVPVALLMFQYRDNALLETIGMFVILPLAIIAAVIWRRNEFIEPVK